MLQNPNLKRVSSNHEKEHVNLLNHTISANYELLVLIILENALYAALGHVIFLLALIQFWN